MDEQGSSTHLAAGGMDAASEMLRLTGDFHIDWWKWLLIAFSTLLLLYLAVRLSLYIFKIIGAILCVICGIAGGYFAQALLNPWLLEHLPGNYARFAPVASGLAGFAVCYGLAALIMLVVRKPAQPLPKSKE